MRMLQIYLFRGYSRDRICKYLTRIGLFLLLFSINLGVLGADMRKVYIGSYSPADQMGINCYGFNPETGKMNFLSGTPGIENPSFLALHSNGRFLYAVSETDGGEGNTSGGVASFRVISPKGDLEKINEVSSGGAAPCHISLDRSERVLMTANYNGGNIAVFPLGEDGSLGKMSSFHQHQGAGSDLPNQRSPHAHSINPDPSNRFAMVADLGLDKLFVYQLNPADGILIPHSPAFVQVKQKSGPRHLAFHPNGSLAYLINEIASTITVFEYDSKAGRLEEIQTVSTLPKDFSGRNSTAEVVVHPSGRYLYGSNRGHDSIAVFKIEESSGRLEPLQYKLSGGRSPRNFCLSPNGNFLLAANQRSDNLVVFPVERASGRLLDPVEEIRTNSPVCVRFAKQ